MIYLIYNLIKKMEDLIRVNKFESNEEELSEIANNKKPIITFSKLNKYFLIPFICPVLHVISNIFKDLILKAKIIKKKEFSKENSYDPTLLYLLILI